MIFDREPKEVSHQLATNVHRNLDSLLALKPPQTKYCGRMAAKIRWGIISTGWISDKFVRDLLVDPATRGVKDVEHVVAAVASRTTERAAEFLKEVSAGSAVKTYGNYAQLCSDPDVDVVYIGTPHSLHYQNVLVALTAGKHVLCEKSLTVNSQQAQALADLARSKNLFLMEAVWTRFQPVSYKVQEIIASGVLGELRTVQSDLSVDWQEATKNNPEHRMVSPKLAGGALLDLGPYSWTWLALLLLPPSSAGKDPITIPNLVASMTFTSTGVDASTQAILKFSQPDGRVVHGTLVTALNVQTSPKRVVIACGSKGFLEIEWPTYCPSAITYSAWESEETFEKPDENKPIISERISFVPRPGNIFGYAFEADEVARCIRDGKIESDRMPLRETILMMEVFDEIRRQGQLRYPESIETLEQHELV